MRQSPMQLALLFSFAFTNACTAPLLAPDATVQAPAKVSVSASVASLSSGQQTALTAIVQDGLGHEILDAVVTWSSETPAIAQVSPSGVVTAIAPGTASIIAQSKSAIAGITLPIVGGTGSPPPVVPPPSSVVLATLPTVLLATTMPAPTGHSIAVPAGGDLQAAINQAVPGDEIVLQAGVTYTGNFTLPVKQGASQNPANSAIITIRSSAISALPEGQRVGPANAGSMAKIVTAVNGVEPIGTAPGATGWRLAGLEITASSGVSTLGRLVRLGDGNPTQNTVAQIPVNLVVDRSYVHGTPTLDIRRCIDLQSAVSAVVDSYISECHSVGSDAQAIAGWNGPGPYKISNNYLEGSGENVMFGGAPVAVPNQMPSDIEFTRNYVSKPLSWKVGDPSYAGTQWSIKNLFEIKTARRVLIEGNVFERSWVESQVGFALLMKGAGNTGPTSDITVRHNIIRGAANGINLFGDVAGLSRVSVIDNLLLDIGSVQWAPAQDQGRLFQVLTTADVTLSHNTGFVPSMMLSFDGAPNTGFTFMDNIVGLGGFGVKGPGAAIGTGSLTAFAPGFNFMGNVLVGNTTDQYPAGNFFSPDASSVGFTNMSADDYSLNANSSFAGKATDHTDPGVNMTTLTAATTGVKR